ncbi:MAG: SIMPL domain-containing protein [Halioglobus sp.]|nr:SIMPL domain-containing protein [Halioglobus sp.]
MYLAAISHRSADISRVTRFVIAAAAALLVLPAAADELNYNLYDLSVTAQRQVENDVMAVTLTASHQAGKSSEVTAAVNRQMADAIALLKQQQDIHYETGNYQTHPVYKDQHIAAWRASQELTLRSRDFEQLAGVVGRLQEQLKVAGMQFEVSDERRAKVQDELLVDALRQLQHRADLVRATMEAADYLLVSASINSNDYAAPVRRAVRGEAMLAADSAPAVEGGDSQVRVMVSGQIQLQYD